MYLSPRDAVSILIKPAQLINTLGPMWHMVTSWVRFSNLVLFCLRICRTSWNELTSTNFHNLQAIRFKCVTLQVESYLEQMRAFPGSQTTDILDEALCVGMSNGPVHIHADLVHPVNELTIQRAQQFLLHYVLLKNKATTSHDIWSPLHMKSHSVKKEGMNLFPFLPFKWKQGHIIQTLVSPDHHVLH